MAQKIAFVGIKAALHYRRHCFESGLKRMGYVIRDSRNGWRANPQDLLVIWNRMGSSHGMALEHEKAGGTVLVAENGYLDGTTPVRHLALSKSLHNGAGTWHVGGPERWAGMGVELRPWRQPGGETVLLPQRGIGSPGVAMPHGWAQKHKHLGRIRQHPGNKQFKVDLERDLKRASAVVTWGSGAAIRALAWGIPVYYGMKRWIGAEAARPMAEMNLGPKCDDEARLRMFERLAWAQFTLPEIEDGFAFDTLLRGTTK